MSYEFTVKAANKPEAKKRVAEEYRRIVTDQPNHTADHKAALDAVNALIDLFPTDRTKDLAVSVHGSISKSVRAPVSKTIAAVESVDLGISVGFIENAERTHAEEAQARAREEREGRERDNRERQEREAAERKQREEREAREAAGLAPEAPK